MAHPAFFNIGPNFGVTDTTAAWDLGVECLGSDGATYRYVKASAAISANDALITDTTAGLDNLKPSAAAAEAVVGVSPVAIASGSYGWVIVRGPASVLAAAGTAAGDQMGSSSTAGTLAVLSVSATPTQAEVQAAVAASAGVGIVATGAVASGVAPVFLS